MSLPLLLTKFCLLFSIFTELLLQPLPTTSASSLSPWIQPVCCLQIDLPVHLTPCSLFTSISLVWLFRTDLILFCYFAVWGLKVLIQWQAHSKYSVFTELSLLLSQLDCSTPWILPVFYSLYIFSFRSFRWEFPYLNSSSGIRTPCSTNRPLPGLLYLLWLFCLHLQRCIARTSLEVQWIRTHLPMQLTLIWFLVQEDPTCLEATKLVHHNC